MALEPLMERFKEKKQHIVDALREACDAIYPSTNLEAIQEMALGFLAHKTPVVRQQVALFLARCFAMSTQTTLPKKVLKAYLPPLVKNLSEADPSVRDSSSEALGAIYKALGEKIFMPNAGELEQIKLDKIKEYADKCVLLNLRGEPRVTVAVAQAPTKPAVSSASSTSINSATIKKPSITKPSAETSAPAAKPKPGGPPKPDAAKKVVKGGGSTNADTKKSIPEEPDLSQETVEERAVEIFGAETINNLANSNWKERQSAIENLANAVKRMPTDEVPCQIVVRTVAKKPGFKDAHFQVLKQRLELITLIADQGFKFSQRSASYCVAEISDKIGDVKTSQQAKDALSKISEQCTLPYVITQIIGPIFEGKNPKNQENFLLWLSQSIKEFGFQGIDMKSLLQHIKSALQNTNPAVRVASIQLISTIYMYMGANFRGLFDQEKPALLEQIDAEIEKVKGMKPPAPIRGKNSASAQSNSSGGGGDNEEEAEEDDPIKQQLQAEAMMPRTDISSQLTDQLMDQLNDKNWKERQAALEKLETILRENKFIEPNLNEFPTHLNKRLIDTNKILATTALKISEKLAQALGSQGRRFIPTLASGMIGALSDNKETLRKTAIGALNAWFDNCGGLAPFIENDLLMESFSGATNPNVKAELCGWLISVLPKCKQGKLPPELKAIIPSVYAYVEDRNPDVRTKAQELILPLMTHVGPNDMLRVMQKAKPTSVTVLQPLIEKARAELAARQPPPVAATSKPANTSSGARVVKPPVKDIYAEDDTNGDDYGNSTPVAPPPAAAKKDNKAPANSKKVTIF
jgi:cytoskeleton-associated protein 5